MPFYLFQNPRTGHVLEVFQRMEDEHSFTDEAGIKYERVFTSPNASIDTSIDAFDASEFARKTASKKETLGDLWDRSREAGEKREKIAGKDSVKEKYLSDYSKARGGKKLPKNLQK